MTECRFCGAPCHVRQVPVSLACSDGYCDAPACVQKMRHLCLPSFLLHCLGSLAIQQYAYEQHPTSGEAYITKLHETEVAKIRQEMQEYHLVEIDEKETKKYVHDSLEYYKKSCRAIA